MNHPSATFFGIEMRICVDQVNGTNASGAVYSRRLTAPMHFSDLISLFLQLDELMNQQRFPEAYQSLRSFSEEKHYLPPDLAAKDPNSGMDEEFVRSIYGNHYTFSIYVASRRSATWQGVLRLLDNIDTIPFSSMLSLLHLIEDYVICAPPTVPNLKTSPYFSS
ncbi:MAG: hypothetical protein LIO58_03595 [Oscillospiraceae bacterium]|nr:hypothetical protein [Oscillospiraceae bacterium]